MLSVIHNRLQAIHSNPTRPFPYLDLALDMSPTQTVRLFDGQEVTRRDLLLLYLHQDYQNGDAYAFLAQSMAPGESITLLDGRHMTRRELLLYALHLNPFCALALCYLGYDLRAGESILFQGQNLFSRGLYFLAIEADPELHIPYAMLAKDLSEGETITLPHQHDSIGIIGLCLIAIDLAPEEAISAYYLLASRLSYGQTIQLLTGTFMTQQELFQKALQQ